MSESPYAAPADDGDVPLAGELKLYTPRAVGWCSFLFSGLIGCGMAAYDRWRSGDERGALGFLIIGPALIVLSCLLGGVLPPSIGDALSVALVFVVPVTLFQLQTALWARHPKARADSPVIPALIGSGFLIALIALFALALLGSGV